VSAVRDGEPVEDTSLGLHDEREDACHEGQRAEPPADEDEGELRQVGLERGVEGGHWQHDRQDDNDREAQESGDAVPHGGAGRVDVAVNFF